MDPIIKYVLSEIQVIAQAPIIFLIALMVSGTVIWWVVNWSLSSVLAHRNAEITLLRSQRDDYKDKLGGASPDQAKAKIDALEQTLNLTIGSSWQPLSKAEIKALSADLSNIPKVRVQIMYENALGKALAQSFYDAFKQAGWHGATFGPGAALDAGITVGQGSGTAAALKTAIESASDLSVEVIRPNESEWPDLVFLAVGINSK